MFERFQIHLESIDARRYDVRSRAGDILPTKRVEIREYQDQLCAVLTLGSAAFEICTIHGRQCHLPEHFGIENEYSMQRKLPRGAVVAVVDLVDVVQVPTLPISLDELVPAKYRTADFQSFGNFKPERYLWLLDNVRRLRQPLKLKARQNLWPLDDEIAEKITMRI